MGHIFDYHFWYLWIADIVLLTLKFKYSPMQGEEEASFYHQKLTIFKPASTLLTGLFCYIANWHIYAIRSNRFVFGCVLMISLVPPFVEVMWDMQSEVDQFYSLIFWLELFCIVLLCRTVEGQ